MFYKIVIMNPTRALDIFKRVYLTHINVPLGRWKSHNHGQTTLKIKYANEDNCGISGINYINTPQKQTNNEINNEIDENLYIYFMGYESVHK